MPVTRCGVIGLLHKTASIDSHEVILRGSLQSQKDPRLWWLGPPTDCQSRYPCNQPKVSLSFRVYLPQLSYISMDTQICKQIAMPVNLPSSRL
jgi:hypothetical protein